MKRILSVFLAMILLIFSYKPVMASENDNNLACSISGRKLFQYMKKDDGKLLVSRYNYGYMNFIEGFKSNAGSLYLIEMINKLINTGAAPNKEKYMEVLVNIIATYDLDCADDIASQRSRDNLKMLKDYAMDFVEMGANAVSTIAGSNPATSKLETAISTAIGGLDVLKENTENWIGALSNLETIIQNYSKYDDFLRLIEKKSEGELKEAAKTLREGMEEAIKIKLNTYQDVSDKNFKNYEKFFFTDIFFNAAKQTPEYKEGEGFKAFVDIGDGVVSRIENLKNSWELGTLIGTMVGNVTVGGENLINRVLEIMAIYDISIILQEEIIDVGDAFLNNLGENTEESFVDDYVALSQYLIGCRIRGEYCLYSIVANDAGLLSWFGKESAEEAKIWYEDKTGKVLKIQNSLMEVLEKETIEISSYFNQYEKLVDELNMEITDSWKFPSGNTYVKDQFYLEIYENLFSMKDEGSDYITLYGIKVGVPIEEAEKAILNNGWVQRYSYNGENVYVSEIENRASLLCLKENTDGLVAGWEVCNFSEEERGPEETGIENGILQEEQVQTESDNIQKNSDNVPEISLKDGSYRYSEGDFLSELQVSTVEGKKECYWGEWYNNGASASVEDFVFTWESGKTEYEVQGQRSGQVLQVRIEPQSESVIITIENKEGVIYYGAGMQKQGKVFNAEYIYVD